MGNEQQRQRAVHTHKRVPFAIEYTATPVPGVATSVTPGAPGASDLSPASTTVVTAVPVPVLKQGETLLTRVIVKLEPPEGEGWTLYQKSYGSIYKLDHTKVYWSRELNEDDFTRSSN